MRNDEIMRVYSHVKINRVISPLPPSTLQRGKPERVISPKPSIRSPSPQPSTHVTTPKPTTHSGSPKPPTRSPSPQPSTRVTTPKPTTHSGSPKPPTRSPSPQTLTRVTTPKSTTHGASPKPPTHSPSPPPSARVTTPKSTTHSASPKSPTRSPSRQPSTRTISPEPSKSIITLQIANIVIEPNTVLLDMVPTPFNPHQEADDDKDDIIYPEGVEEHHPYQTVARYRRAIGESTNFRVKPLLVGEDSVETLVLGLENFARQKNCTLTFAGEDQQFSNSIYRAAAGLVDIGSIHLLAADSLLTANFEFEIDLTYDPEIFQSEDHIQKFVQDFCEAISNAVSCDNSNVRVFSINKIADEEGKGQVNFGLTTPEPKRTEELAHDLKIYASSGFGTDTILQYVKPAEYECIWKPALNYLQIRPSDLDPQFNFDYRQPDLPKEETRGSYPYYCPLGWFCHALKVLDKYDKDVTWIGCINAEGEWPVAFHGTHSGAVSSIVQRGLSPGAAKTDVMIGEAIEQIDEEANRPGLYVATHCEGGSYPQYTVPFTVTTFPDKSEQFSMVFQCRVQPGKFTTHTSPVSVGEAWRIVDPNSIRPYGILLKKERPTEEEVESSTEEKVKSSSENNVADSTKQNEDNTTETKQEDSTDEVQETSE
ncbi:unnamed protein product [Rotaria sp. Silwood1]|nr:unnamed protein product [Rotaria sp. Silwood1]